MITKKVKEIIITTLSVSDKDINLDTNLKKDLNADSLDAVEVIMGVEEEFGIEIPDEVIHKISTIKDIVEYIESVK